MHPALEAQRGGRGRGSTTVHSGPTVSRCPLEIQRSAAHWATRVASLVGWLALLSGCGAPEIARVEVGVEETRTELELEARLDVQPWVRVEVETRDVPRDRAIEQFPRISELVLIAEGPDGAVFQRRCDPFETHVFRRLQVEEDRRRYEGRLDACRFVAGPGPLVLRVRRLDAIEHDRYEIVHTELVLRARPSP